MTVVDNDNENDVRLKDELYSLVGAGARHCDCSQNRRRSVEIQSKVQTTTIGQERNSYRMETLPLMDIEKKSKNISQSDEAKEKK